MISSTKQKSIFIFHAITMNRSKAFKLKKEHKSTIHFKLKMEHISSEALSVEDSFV